MKKYLAEAIGTFMLVFFGTGAIIIDQQFDGIITHLGIAIAFGAAVTTIIYALGDVSGAHINPVVTIAFWMAGRMSFNKVPGYLLSQLIGAILASLLLRISFPENNTLGATLPSGNPMQSFLFEIIMTYFLMMVIIHVSTGSKEKGIMAGLAVGTTVMLEALFAGPISGASMNPARSLAPALVSGEMQHLWIYLVAPMLGAALSIGTWKIMKTN